ncbi:conserved membrane hypothetical protein [Imperialibacter sp. EC-SDR9]|nr:conserved membrane hypothetical protein [Imperialibacter sp. 89]CAD5296662.1 conserved membrane hypothetical protein [Imperialibacter sp. 75]VVT33856.1 conserved membrane hypothetical protein [Imperialibacter sp. EC-SDR9]
MIFTINILQRDIKIEPAYVFLCLAIISLPINKELAGPFRFTDIFLVLSLLSVIGRIKISQSLFQIILALLVIISISSVIGLWAFGVRNIQNIGFIYKFLVPIFPIFILNSIRISPSRLKTLNKLLLWTFFFLSAWVYIYLFLRITGRIHGVFRPSFPFSGNLYQSDAHLYSCYLAMSLVMYNFHWKKIFGHHHFMVIFINVASVPAMVLTGSKTGIAVLMFSQLLHILISFRSFRTVRKQTVYLAVIILIGGIYLISKIDFDRGLIALAERAMDFNSGDDSSMSRIRKLLLSFEQTSATFFLFGVGLISNYVTWYDGLIGSTNGFLGVFGLVLMVFIIVGLVRSTFFLAKNNNRIPYFAPFLIVLCTYILANLITEYYLVTRGVLPTSVFLMLLHLQISEPDKNAVIPLSKSSTL